MTLTARLGGGTEDHEQNLGKANTGYIGSVGAALCTVLQTVNQTVSHCALDASRYTLDRTDSKVSSVRNRVPRPGTSKELISE